MWMRWMVRNTGSWIRIWAIVCRPHCGGVGLFCSILKCDEVSNPDNCFACASYSEILVDMINDYISLTLLKNRLVTRTGKKVIRV